LIALVVLVASPASAGENWRNAPLVDVRTGETFRISDFAGTPVLLETFAVWCPTCTRQQEEIARLHEKLGDEFVSVSLNVDPNEDAATVREHANDHGFDWRYAVSQPQVTRALMAEFGTGIVAATATPVVLIGPDQEGSLLRRGLKRADALEKLVDEELGE
jgi:thiol-disulfide isomerase/thioredoxin